MRDNEIESLRKSCGMNTGIDECNDISSISEEEALERSEEFWKEQVTYWHKIGVREKALFNRTLAAHLLKADFPLKQRLVNHIISFFGISRLPAANKAQGKPRPSQLDEEKLYWYRKAMYLQKGALHDASLNKKLYHGALFGSAQWLWEKLVLNRRNKQLASDMKEPARPRERSVKSPDLISVVTPTHNRAHLLERCIESLLKQTYDNFELLLIDDGSTDETYDFISRYKDERIVYCYIPKSGVSAARNVGLRLAKGEYVVFFDSDNLLDSGFLEEMHGAISKADDATGFVYCDCDLYQNDTFIETFKEEYSPALMFRKPIIDLGTNIFKGEVFSDGAFFNEDMDKFVDYELLLRISAKWECKHYKKTLLHYFRLEDGITLAPESSRDMRKNYAAIKKTKRNILKVGYVLWDYPSLSQSFVHSEIKWLLENGIDVKVYYKEAPDKAAKLDYDVQSFKVESFKELAGLALKHGRHCLHSHFAYPVATLLTWPAAEMARIPFTVIPHAVDIFAYTNEGRNKLDKMAHSEMCGAVFACGDFHRKFFIEHGVPRNKIILKPNPLNFSLLEELNRSEAVVDRDIRSVVYVGRFVEKKGCSDIIKTAKRLSDLPLRFDLYGYGPLEDEIAREAEGLPNLKVHLGGLDYKDYVRIIKSSDIFFLPCIRAKNGDMDGLPTVLMEALAMGVPVLTTGLASIPYLVEDAVTGFVCEPGDIDCFESKLRKLSGMRMKELQQVVENGKARLRERFDPEIVHNRLLDTWIK